jgi:hypothetical protein
MICMDDDIETLVDELILGQVVTSIGRLFSRWQRGP